MDVRCEKCGTEYELDESRLKASGVTVKCTSCGHMFKVRRRAAASAGGPKGGELRTWLVRMTDGEIRACYELSTLQEWIAAGSVTPECKISRTGKKWKRLGDIAELASFFKTSPARSGTVPTGGGGAPVTHPHTVRRDGASKTATLPQPSTGGPAVPRDVSAQKPAARRTLMGTPSPALSAKGTGEPSGFDDPGGDVTKPLSDEQREQVRQAIRESAGPRPMAVGDAPTDMETTELPRPSPEALQSDTIDQREETTEIVPRPELDDDPFEATQELDEAELVDEEEDAPTARPDEIAENEGPTLLHVPRAGRRSDTEAEEAPKPTVAERPRAARAGAAVAPVKAADSGGWSKPGKFGGTLDGDETGPSGPIGGLRRSATASEDAPFVRGKAAVDDAFDDGGDYVPVRRSGGAGKWVVIASLMLLGAAGGVVFFVMNNGGGEGAAVTFDAAGPQVESMGDASGAPPATGEAAALAAASEALGLDQPESLAAANDRLAALESPDELLAVLVTRAKIAAALAQSDLDRARAADGAEARKLTSSAREHASAGAELAKKARAEAPTDPQVLALTADLVRLQGKSPREIERWLRKASAGADAQPAEVQRYIRYVQGMVMLRDGKTADARKIFEGLVDDSLPDVRARYRLALMDFDDTRYEESKAGAEAVLSTSPEHAGAALLLQRLAAKLEVSSADPMPPEDDDDGGSAGGGSAGGGSAGRGGGGGGGASYDQLLASGNRYAERGNCGRAMDAYRQALDKNPAGVAALTGLGYCHIDRRQFAQAQAKFRAALGVSPRYQGALYGIAEAYQQQGLKDKAVAAYRKYLSVHPSGSRSSSAKRQIARLSSKPAGGGDTGGGGGGGKDTGAGETGGGDSGDSGDTGANGGGDTGGEDTGSDPGTDTGADADDTEPPAPDPTPAPEPEPAPAEPSGDDSP